MEWAGQQILKNVLKREQGSLDDPDLGWIGDVNLRFISELSIGLSDELSTGLFTTN